MKLELKAYGSLCELEIFTINGVDASYRDFGDRQDIDTYNAEDYGCGDMQFIPNEEIDLDILIKYAISYEDYRKIQEELDVLSFGACGWCV